ncbi:Cell division protein [Alkalibacterium sp. AK22]|uniref:penicillin-binding transpeptidase domain-containing protein n=1 Tax=Alkalibacterium sp. AK22 TaxID=1229520 RepID=UPI000450A6A8|nr:penicillin-binding transpeptidase domain-containing protein [Alkalibacterium sp. AK22]EXJ22446.1 Cell division protein [Alkalibacterium sp. AK22]
MKKPTQKRTEKHKSHIPFRLNLLFFLVFLMFASLILRLGYMQIIRADDFIAEVQRTERTTITGSVPRGEIFDANLRKLVGNEARATITYTRGRNVSASQMAEVAYDLAGFIEMPSVPFFEVDSGADLTRRDLQDFFIATNQEEIRERMSDEDMQLDGGEAYQSMISYVEDEELEEFSRRELAAAAIFRRMNAAFALSTVNIKNEDVSQDEIARVSENLDSLPGVGTGTDWVRMFPEGDMLRSIIGRVSTERQGVPSDQVRSFLARGYTRNDRVGRTQLESQYESVLRGTRSRLDTETNSRGEIINQIEKYSGQKGDNLILTIDIDFQETVEQIAIDSLQERQGLNNSIYIVAMDPRNGDVLAMTGKTVDENGQVRDNALGTIQAAYEMGSSVKGASILAAAMDGVLDETNNQIFDTPIRMAGSQDIRSFFNPTGANSVMMNEVSALERSSNVYMSKLAMRMGGEFDHVQGSGLSMDAQRALDTQRMYFNQFGLGVPTGIDLPNESTGIAAPLVNPGQSLFFSFGQFDTYTPMQLAQYVATIANGGTRLAPRLVSEIRDTDPSTGGVGNLRTEIEPRILNHINVEESMMETVHQGFYAAVNGSNGTARSHFANTPYVSAGKTGTAEATFWREGSDRNGEGVINTTYVGFAPFDNPEIAIATVVPHLPRSGRTNQESQRATRRVLDAFFGVGEFESNTQPTDNIHELEEMNEESEQEETETEE